MQSIDAFDRRRRSPAPSLALGGPARPSRMLSFRSRLTAVAWRTLAACTLAMSACGGDASSADEVPTLPPTAFRDAVEARDLDAIIATFADDIRLYSPVLPDPFVGRERVARLFGVLIKVFEDIRIGDEFDAEGRYVLTFDARIGTEEVFVADLLRFDETGRIAEFVVTMRPLPGILALAAAVAPHLPEING